MLIQFANIMFVIFLSIFTFRFFYKTQKNGLRVAIRDLIPFTEDDDFWRYLFVIIGIIHNIKITLK